MKGGDLMTIYGRIRKLREEQEMTQEELAKKIGYKSRSTINKIESGLRDINQSQIILFAKALNVTPAYLMGWEDEPSEDIEKISLAIGLIKYFIDVPEEFPDWFEIGNGIESIWENYKNIDIDIQKIMAYCEHLTNKFDKNKQLTDMELYELTVISFLEIDLLHNSDTNSFTLNVIDFANQNFIICIDTPDLPMINIEPKKSQLRKLLSLESITTSVFKSPLALTTKSFDDLKLNDTLDLKNDKDRTLINSFEKLNDLGKKEAITRVDELTFIPKYIKDDFEQLNAAHEIPGASEEDKQYDEDIMDDENF